MAARRPLPRRRSARVLVTTRLLVLLFVAPSASYFSLDRFAMPPRQRVRGPPTAVTSILDEAASLAAMDAAAIEMDAVKAVRGSDGRLQPVLTLPGDTLETNRVMIWLTLASTALTAGTLVHAFAASVLGGTLPIAPILAIGLGLVMGELFSGTFHWATDNCAAS